MFHIKYCREVILKILYQMDVLDINETVSGEFFQDNLNYFRGLNNKEKDFIKMVVHQILEDKCQIVFYGSIFFTDVKNESHLPQSWYPLYL